MALETKPLSQIAQDSFAILIREYTNNLNRELAVLSDHALSSEGLLALDGWNVQQQPDGRFRFERQGPDPEPEKPAPEPPA